jgi:Glycosyltransferase like family 2
VKIVVVIPTRNRRDLVPATISSVIADGDPAVSVLVSDNSTDPRQAESLQLWCDDLGVERLRYLRPPSPLPMSTHWQWALERALEDSTQTHVMYLTDRLVLRPGALAQLVTLVNAHPNEVITFGDDVVLDYETPVTLFERPWTGKLFRVSADQLLRAVGRGIVLAAPTMLNTVAPRTVLADIESVYGSVFASIAPDHCFSYRCLDRVDSVLHCDRPLIIQRGLWRSNGFSQIRGVTNADHVDFLRELGDSAINPHAPVPALLTVSNAIYNEYEYVRHDPGSSKLAPLSRHNYLGANARDVARLENPELQARMRQVLSEHGWSRAVRMRYLLGLSLSAAGYYWRRPRAVLRRLGRKPGTSGEFRDSEQALAYTLAHPSAPRPEADHLWPLMSRPGAVRELTSNLVADGARRDRGHDPHAVL